VSATRGRAARPPGTPTTLRNELRWAVLLLALHAALAIWGAARNSVTFDENFHLPAGVAYVTRGYTAASVAQPPLIKALAALPALAAGARVPPDSVLGAHDENRVGEAFMRLNADRYHRVYFAARMVGVALSLLLAWLVWSFARRLHGPRGALLALAVYALLPESLAHAGLVGMDLPTGLGFLATVYAFWRFAETGSPRWWLALALALGATCLTRFSALQLGPILAGLFVVGVATARIERPRRVLLGLALLPLTSLLALHVGYLGYTTLGPISQYAFRSEAFQSLQSSHPGLRPPLPDPYVGGLDYLLSLAESAKPSYLLGQIREGHTWYYFPVALLLKWPMAFLGLLLLRLVSLRRADGPVQLWQGALVVIPTAVVLGSAMMAHLEYGVRYLFPMLPFLCVWLGALANGGPGGGSRDAPTRAARRDLGRASSPSARGLWRGRVVAALVVVLAVETATAAPWYLTFFNLAAGGPGNGDRRLNDSNVDWGQGLLALRDELSRRRIGRIHLAYHGTTDPGIYGIDYIPYQGGQLGPESEWFAVSSYFLVGLPAGMTTRTGRSGFVQFLGFDKLRDQVPVARPARCMYLYRLPTRVAK